jgi:hypothetical protein
MYCTNLVEAIVSNAIREWVYTTSHGALEIKVQVHDVIKDLVLNTPIHRRITIPYLKIKLYRIVGAL